MADHAIVQVLDILIRVVNTATVCMPRGSYKDFHHNVKDLLGTTFTIIHYQLEKHGAPASASQLEVNTYFACTAVLCFLPA